MNSAVVIFFSAGNDKVNPAANLLRMERADIVMIMIQPIPVDMSLSRENDGGSSAETRLEPVPIVLDILSNRKMDLNLGLTKSKDGLDSTTNLSWKGHLNHLCSKT